MKQSCTADRLLCVTGEALWAEFDLKIFALLLRYFANKAEYCREFLSKNFKF